MIRRSSRGHESAALSKTVAAAGRDFGFPISQVRTLVSLLQDNRRSCIEARDIAQGHLADVRQKLKELRELAKSLTAFVRDCDTQCAGGPGPNCVILDDLSQPPKRKSCC